MKYNNNLIKCNNKLESNFKDIKINIWKNIINK